MLSRFFLISTLLLVGITTATVAIGTPFAETIERIKAIEIPQMRSGNLTLNRRFIDGVPGLPQCSNPDFPNLMSSWCLTAETIRATCASSDPANRKECDTPCPPNTFCLDFRLATTDNEAFSKFALCINNKYVSNFNGKRRDKRGVICKSFAFNLNSDQGTVSVSVYDSTHRPVLVRGIEVHTGNLNMSMSDTSDYSIIVDRGEHRMQVCLWVLYKITVFALFTVLEGTYSSKG
ncbi:hypothetical protein Glove_5g8 [Diversispora epigaea]|uniref:Uncharacterized protein n=1 Tax=Diversispora epigaea TaxID=1348612 RepID=A0A397JPA9_9GLOM|nr:hypothetical protein Glove_5g8 [Diversispora epigaea]